MNLALALNFQLPAVADQTLPEWILLVPAGEFTGRDKRSWQNDAAETVVNAVVDYGQDIPVNIEHATEIKGPRDLYSEIVILVMSMSTRYKIKH